MGLLLVGVPVSDKVSEGVRINILQKYWGGDVHFLHTQKEMNMAKCSFHAIPLPPQEAPFARFSPWGGRYQFLI